MGQRGAVAETKLLQFLGDQKIFPRVEQASCGGAQGAGEGNVCQAVKDPLAFFLLRRGVAFETSPVGSPAAKEGSGLSQSGGQHGGKAGGFQALGSEIPEEKYRGTNGQHLFDSIRKGSGEGFVHSQEIAFHTGAKRHEGKPYSQNPQAGGCQGITQKNSGSWACQEEQQKGDG